MSPIPPPVEQVMYARAVADELKPNDAQNGELLVDNEDLLDVALNQALAESGMYLFSRRSYTLSSFSSHALAGVLTCARVEHIQLDPYEGGSTRMRGGIPAITLPAGYLGSSLIGAALVTCGFDTNASKVAVLVLAFLWILTLWWARRSWIAWATIAFVAGLILICWLVADSVALRFLVLFIGTMSCFYSIWDIIDDTLQRKVNTSDASEYAAIIGCCGSRFWGAFWLLQASIFFIAAILVGLLAFDDDFATQARKAETFLGGTP